MKALKWIGRVFVNYPAVVSGLIAVGVAAHFAWSREQSEVNVALALANTTAEDPAGVLTSLSLGVAGVAAMVGGFAGVVVIFGLGTENDRFRLLRTQGSRRLRANWISVVLSSFAGAFGALTAAVVVVAFGSEQGMWILEVCLLVAAHAAVRLTALLAGLARIVDGGDQDQVRASRIVPTSALISGDPPIR